MVTRSIGVAFVSVTVLACSVKVPPPTTTANSVQAIDDRLRGEWTLVSLSAKPGPDTMMVWDATGVLRYDALRRIHIQLELNDPARGRRRRHVDLSATVIIDPVACTLTLQNVVDHSDAIPDVMEPERLRRFAFSRHHLTTDVLDAGGRVVASLVWQKAKAAGSRQE